MLELDPELIALVKEKHIPFYMDVAKSTAGLSIAQRRRVGAVILTPQRSMFTGYNGMPEGMPNRCEDIDGRTLPYVVHAEANALDKMAKEGVSAAGSVCFCTCYPCVECAKRLVAVGVKWIIYQEEYSSDMASKLFKHFGVQVYCYTQMQGLGFHVGLKEAK